jgi:hypothetical protein
MSYFLTLSLITFGIANAQAADTPVSGEVHPNEMNYEEVVQAGQDLLDQEITTFGTFGGFCKDRERSQQILFPIYAPGTAVIGECVFDSPLMGRTTLANINEVAKLELGQSIAVHGAVRDYRELDERSIMDFTWIAPSERTEAIEREEPKPAKKDSAAAAASPAADVEPETSRASITNHTDKSVREMIVAHTSSKGMTCTYVESRDLAGHVPAGEGVATTMADDEEFLRVNLQDGTWLAFSPTSATLLGESLDSGFELLSFHLYEQQFTYTYLNAGMKFAFVCTP